MPKLRCDRCGAELQAGSYYDMTLELKSDTEPLELTEGLGRDLQAEIEELVDRTRDMDPAQLEADVYTQMQFRVCRGCQQVLLHDPLQRGSLSASDWPDFDVDDFLDSLGPDSPDTR